MTFDLAKLSDHPGLHRVVGEVLAVWPEHDGYCETRFRDDPPGFLRRSEELADLVLKLVGPDLRTYCADYRWMCEAFVAEEYYFRSEGRYRLSTFKEAYEQIYSNAEYMTRYVRGILISQFIWSPHALAFDYFRTHFLPGNESGARHLEVGPGHGLGLYFAAQDPRIGTLEAWDVSQSSVVATRHALTQLGVTRPVNLVEQDVLAAPAREGAFDTDFSLTRNLNLYYDSSHIYDPEEYRDILRRVARGDHVLRAADWPRFEATLRKAIEEFAP